MDEQQPREILTIGQLGHHVGLHVTVNLEGKTVGGGVRPRELDEVQPGGVPDEITELVRAGKTLEAIKRYRALNGATLDEARAYIAKLGLGV